MLKLRAELTIRGGRGSGAYQRKVGVFPLLFSPLPFLPHSPPLEAGPLNAASGLRECCKLPSGVWDGAPAEIDFGAF